MALEMSLPSRRVVDVVSIRKMDDSAKSVREVVHLMHKPLITRVVAEREGKELTSLISLYNRSLANSVKWQCCNYVAVF